MSGHNPSLASHLEAGAKTSRTKTAVNNSHFHAGIYIHPMKGKEREKKKKADSLCNSNKPPHGDLQLERTSLNRFWTSWWDAMLRVPCCCCCSGWSPSYFHPAFTRVRSMSRRDGNHHGNMQPHNSLAYMFSSQRDSCLHFNRSALVFATLW